ncbi:MAG: hypothetical protein BRC32_04535 [Actinobacteria bacterium QS_8_72_14]|nr:MAG: hypothetical protein BRC32_04535 [Actinobacteria bacterium QS_8_72_14]
MDLYAQQHRNRRVTAALFVGVGLVVVALGAGLTYVFGVTDPFIMVGVGVVIAAVLMAITWKIADRAVLRSAGAREPNPDVAEEARVTDIVEGVAMAAGIPAPQVFVIDDDSLNAFAVGRSPESGKVAFTTGLLHALQRSEVEAVAAHEVSHITGRDSLIGVYTAVLLGFAVIAARVMFRGVLFRGMMGGGGRGGRGGGGGHMIMLLIALVVAILAAVAAFVLSRAVSRKRESPAGDLPQRGDAVAQLQHPLDVLRVQGTLGSTTTRTFHNEGRRRSARAARCSATTVSISSSSVLSAHGLELCNRPRARHASMRATAPSTSSSGSIPSSVAAATACSYSSESRVTVARGGVLMHESVSRVSSPRLGPSTGLLGALGPVPQVLAYPANPRLGMATSAWPGWRRTSRRPHHTRAAVSTMAEASRA